MTTSIYPTNVQLCGTCVVATGDAEINITVLDFNDHTPIFLNPVTSVSVSEGVAPGTILTDFNVTDSDSGLFGVLGVIYSIVAGMVLVSVHEAQTMRCLSLQETLISSQ